ncbi:hypothetical protein ACSDR0_44495 [Streptosporangium sp. G11]|uniref:hypothetical protein n=1 Tax=Streptosporangium sp. G11 TaxID=3436926 RepID=UPI003EB81DA2
MHTPEVARRAWHGVDVLLKLYARCVDGRHEMANKQIMEALTTWHPGPFTGCHARAPLALPGGA